jgi:hypothetical protein
VVIYIRYLQKREGTADTDGKANNKREKTMNSKKTKLLGLSVVATALVAMMAFNISAKERRLSPPDNCSIVSNDSDLYFSTGGYLYAENFGYYVCGIPNDSYFNNTEIKRINIHLYNYSSSNSVSARPCVRDYNSNDVYCEPSKSTTAAGEVRLSWTGVNFANYLTYETYVYGTMYTGDRLRLIWASQ